MMDQTARDLLMKLLKRGDKCGAGVRVRSASLTNADLSKYRDGRSFTAKESFETTMKAARAIGAVAMTWDDPREEGFISRIDLVDTGALASFLGVKTLETQIQEARTLFKPLIDRFPVLDEVIMAWSELRPIRRNHGPESAGKWLDAAKVIQQSLDRPSENVESIPLREFSAQLFNDSKRIEKLLIPLDILLSGSVESEIQTPEAIWQELGLFREEQPIRLAGNIRVRRDRVTAYLDVPYTALPGDTIISLVDMPNLVMTIENQTTFHSEARKRCNESVLLVYTAGMPSPVWRRTYIRILQTIPDNVPLFHWGDVDEGGFRIASRLQEDARSINREIQPWKMHPNDIPPNRKVKASNHTLKRIKYFAAAAGWINLGEAVAADGFTVEQEGL